MSGERARTHGVDKKRNHQNIAELWTAYLRIRRDPEAPLDALDAAHMMILMKIARTQYGDLNPDDWLDMCGYSGSAGEIAEQGDD